MFRRSKRSWSSYLVALSCCAGAGFAAAACGFSGTTNGTGGTGSGGGASNPTAGNGPNPTGGNTSTTGGNTSTTGGNNPNPTAGNAGTGTAGSGTGGGGGGESPVKGAPNYERTGTWPTQPVKIQTAPGKLTYTKQVIHAQFLAESCSIADYNNDGMPDVSAGRIWYEGPAFTKQHPFREGHGVLPSAGNGAEIDTGVSDDWSDFPFDLDFDGNTDIINIAQCDVNEVEKTNPKVGTVQPKATAYWYKNPGPAGQAGDPNWQKFLIHSDVRLEQHGLLDMNNDGFPEIYGACKGCNPPTTKGFYFGNPANPQAGWSYQAVTTAVTFPFGGLGWMHGAGGGDVNGDGLTDILERSGAWLQPKAGGTWNATPCTGKDTPAGCGYIKQNFYDGLPDDQGNKGASHMYAADMDMDGIPDVVAADWAHGEGLYWYKQSADQKFTKYQFMGSAADKGKWGAGFSEPHALQVVDMDGDGRLDIVTGKMRFAHPYGYGDPDPDGVPYLYVFKNVAAQDPNSGAPITLKPMLVDPVTPGMIGTPAGGMGVGRQLAVGHVNTDGIMDICIASKVGLAVFLGQ
jgi:hypothetical protein